MTETVRKPKVVLTDYSFPLEVELPKLKVIEREVGAETQTVPYGDRAALLAALQDADVALVHRARMDAEALANAPRLGLIAKCGIGVDTIDVAEATARGILLVNNPENGAPEVADHTMALLLALARKLTLADRNARLKPFTRTHDFTYMGFRLENKILGLIGLGGIGRRVAVRAQGFGMKVVAYTPRLTEERASEVGARAVSLDTLLAESDVVSLHCPLRPESRHMIGSRELEMMKPSAIFMNTARGPLVDEAALVRALETGRIAGAALDVFESEPFTPENPLSKFDNVVITPHAGWSSYEALDDVEATAARQAIQFLRGEIPDHLMNRSVLDHRRGIRS